jgi:DNA-binding CsgD family transcriptional regulator
MCIRDRIEDDGLGFEVERALAAGVSSGLARMRERAQLLAGEFSVESAPGAGTQLKVEFPLADKVLAAEMENRDTASLDGFDTLTKRERVILQLAAEGHTSPEIAGELFISPRTAEKHRANLLRKRSLRSQTDLVQLRHPARAARGVSRLRRVTGTADFGSAIRRWRWQFRLPTARVPGERSRSGAQTGSSAPHSGDSAVRTKYQLLRIAGVSHYLRDRRR